MRSQKLTDALHGWNWGGPCVLFSGPTGVGKSTAMAAALVRLILREEPAWRRILGIRWAVTGELAAARSQWPLGHGECPSMAKARDCRLLILDNFGFGDRDQRFVDELFVLLDYRKTRDLPVWTSTELSPEQLCSHPYSDQLLRRLIERRGRQGIVVSC